MKALQDIAKKNERLMDQFAKQYGRQLVDLLPEILAYLKENKDKVGGLSSIPVTNRLIKDLLNRAGLPLWFQYADAITAMAEESLRDLSELFGEIGFAQVMEPARLAFRKAYTVTLDDMATESVKIEATLIRAVKGQIERMQVVPLSIKEASFALEPLQKKLRNQAKTLLNTGMAAVQREVQLTTGELLKGQGFEVVYTYQGPIDKVTRDFCGPLVGRSFTAKQIGKLRNKDGSNVFKYGGGLNCRHTWFATTRQNAEARGLVFGNKDDILDANDPI